MSSFIGTCYFRSKKEAYKYFFKEGNDKASVDQYLKEELAYVGPPPNPKKLKLSVVEGRYWLEEN